MTKLHTPIWLSPRAYWSLGILVLLYAAGAAAAPFWWLALAGSVLFVFALIADAITGPRRNALTVQRIEPEPFSLRRPATLAYRIRNASLTTLRIGIFEAPSPLLHYDLDEATTLVPPLAESQLSRPVTPVTRGTASLATLYVWYETPLGLLRRRLTLHDESEIRVYPDLSAVERYGTLHARNRLIEAGLRRMRLRGAGTEPETVREWTSDDPFRSVNWKATARRGKLMVAQYEVERSQNVMILLDAGRLMTSRVGDQRKFDYAVTAALSVASIASLANDKVGMVAFAGDIIRGFAPRSTGRSLATLSAQIHDLEPRFEESDYDAAFAYTRTHVRKRSLIIFFTDMLDPVAQSAALAEIGTLSRRHVVICAFMNDAAIDHTLTTDPCTARDAYATGVALELRSERQTARALLSRMGVHVIDVPASQLTTTLIDQYLLIKQRGLL